MRKRSRSFHDQPRAFSFFQFKHLERIRIPSQSIIYHASLSLRSNFHGTIRKVFVRHFRRVDDDIDATTTTTTTVHSGLVDMSWKSFLGMKKEEKERGGAGKKNARSIPEISSLVVRVSPQNGAQEARECSRRRMLETRQRDTRKEWRGEGRRKGWYRIKGVCHRRRREGKGGVVVALTLPRSGKQCFRIVVHNERGYQGTCTHVRPLTVLVIMSTQIMRGDWCSIYIYIYTRYPPEKRNGEECEARGSEIGGRGSCAQDPLDGYKTSCPQRRPFRIYRRSSATRASHLDDGKKRERRKKMIAR